MSQMARRYEAINLAQGFPDFPCPDALKRAAIEAIEGDINQYAVTWGDPAFRQAIAEKESAYLGIPINPDTDVTVTCGATEAMAATMLATISLRALLRELRPGRHHCRSRAALRHPAPARMALR
jgi:L-glutamine---4-(methylsulfanyl)-2-oxobutanoate aminotransferase